jgi:hypothetical protein
MTKTLAFLIVLAAVAVGCGSEGAQEAGPVPTVPGNPPTETTEPEPAPETNPTETEAEAEDPDEPSEPVPVKCDSQTGGEEGIYTNLVDVRVGSHRYFDRAVFEFAPPEPNPNPAGKSGIPRYVIKAARPPFTEDPSDLPITVGGNAFTRIVLQGASGFDFDGNATYEGPRRLTPGFETLTEVVEGGDFEATMTWIMGLSQRACWQIQELENPDRLVIDFQHVDV